MEEVIRYGAGVHHPTSVSKCKRASTQPHAHHGFEFLGQYALNHPPPPTPCGIHCTFPDRPIRAVFYWYCNHWPQDPPLGPSVSPSPATYIPHTARRTVNSDTEAAAVVAGLLPTSHKQLVWTQFHQLLALLRGPAPVCHQFRAHGQCRWGEDCHYAHVAQAGGDSPGLVPVLGCGADPTPDPNPDPILDTKCNDPEAHQTPGGAVEVPAVACAAPSSGSASSPGEAPPPTPTPAPCPPPGAGSEAELDTVAAPTVASAAATPSPAAAAPGEVGAVLATLDQHLCRCGCLAATAP